MCPGGFSRREWGPLPCPSPQEFREIGGGVNKLTSNETRYKVHKVAWIEGGKCRSNIQQRNQHKRKHHTSTLQGENRNCIDARGLSRSPINPGADQGGQERPRLLAGLPGQSGIGGNRQGDGGVPPRGGPGKEEERAVRHQTAHQQGHPKGQEGPGSLNPRARGEEVEDILHNIRAAVTVGGRGQGEDDGGDPAPEECCGEGKTCDQ